MKHIPKLFFSHYNNHLSQCDTCSQSKKVYRVEEKSFLPLAKTGKLQIIVVRVGESLKFTPRITPRKPLACEGLPLAKFSWFWDNTQKRLFCDPLGVAKGSFCEG